jgi:hypothetical protein
MGSPQLGQGISRGVAWGFASDGEGVDAASSERGSLGRAGFRGAAGRARPEGTTGGLPPPITIFLNFSNTLRRVSS